MQGQQYVIEGITRPQTWSHGSDARAWCVMASRNHNICHRSMEPCRSYLGTTQGHDYVRIAERYTYTQRGGRLMCAVSDRDLRQQGMQVRLCDGHAHVRGSGFKPRRSRAPDQAAWVRLCHGADVRRKGATWPSRINLEETSDPWRWFGS
jgi:hypothetical protein